MAWTTITKPTLGEATKKTAFADAVIDNLVDLNNRASLGAGATIQNQSFEFDTDVDGIPDGWVKTLYAGGSGSIVSSDSADGKYAYKFTHPGGGGNGGGYLTSDYFDWTPIRNRGVVFNVKCSVTGIKVVGRVKFYDADKAFLSNTDFYTSVANRLAWTLVYGKNFETPVTARFAKLELHGGVDDTNVAGDVYFDYAQVVDYEPFPGYLPFTDSSINQAEGSISSGSYADIGSNQSVTIPVGAGLLAMYIEAKQSGGVTPTTYARARIGTTYSTAFSTASATYVGGWIYLDVSALSGAQSVRLQVYTTEGGSGVAYAKCPSGNAKYCKAGRYVYDGVNGTAAFETS